MAINCLKSQHQESHLHSSPSLTFLLCSRS